MTKLRNYLIIFTIITISIISCSALANVRRTDCTIEDGKNPTLALIISYETAHYGEGPEGFNTKDIEFIMEELINLGFDVFYINPDLDRPLSITLNNTKDWFQRKSFMANYFKKDYDYVSYIQYRNSGSIGSIYKVEKRVIIEKLNITEESKSEFMTDKELFSVERRVSKHTEKDYVPQYRREYKLKTVDITKFDILNFYNSYVRDIRNYEKIIEGEKPICFNFVYYNYM